MEKIMKFNPQPRTILRPVFVAAMTATLSLAIALPLRAATPEPAKVPTITAPVPKPAEQCLKDLSAFHRQMQKDGYWVGGSDFGYGYGYGYNYGAGLYSPMTGANAPGASEYVHARPGYDVRTLLAAAQILAQRGDQASCEALLSQTRPIYDGYAADLRSGNVPTYDAANFRRAQLATAQPVSAQNVSYSSDELIGTEVLNSKGEELGSVNDMVHSPKTGKIAYLIVGRGGLFGINEKYVPVPWTDFKATTGAKLLMLDTTKDVMGAAPQIKASRFTTDGEFDKLSQQVNSYWAAHPAK
jgi:sporulation protein YlmC with PRC-barrel domain